MNNYQNITYSPADFQTEAPDCRFDRIQQTDYQYAFELQNPSTFTGKELDSETGYSYFGARYNDAELSGLFFSVDPMADKYPNISSYAYCAWNPVKLVDPDGREMDDYRIYSNGTIEKKVTPDNFDRFIFVNNNRGEASPTEVEIGQFDKNENGLIKMPSNFSFQNNDFGITMLYMILQQFYLVGMIFYKLY